jgi:F0F1-type ATP synthase assembly protein I
MAGDRPSQRPHDDDEAAAGASQGWTAISYLIGGIVVWGLLGWLADRWLDTGGIATAVGAVIGAAGGVYLVVRQLGGTKKKGGG